MENVAFILNFRFLKKFQQVHAYVFLCFQVSLIYMETDTLCFPSTTYVTGKLHLLYFITNNSIHDTFPIKRNYDETHL